jgi:HAD superfamily hydrolase (TIGR01549 family)
VDALSTPLAGTVEKCKIEWQRIATTLGAGFDAPSAHPWRRYRLGPVEVVLADFERTLVRLFEDSGTEQKFFQEVWDLCAQRGVPERVLRTAGESPYSLWRKAHQWMRAPWRQALRLKRPSNPLHVERMYHAVDRIAIKHEMAVADQIRLFDDVQPVLKELKNAGIPVVIVSNNAKKAVERVLQENNAEDLIDHIVGREFKHWMLGNLKPRPNLVLAALRGSDASRALLVGDSVDNMKAARAAKIRYSVGVLEHSTFSAKQLRRAGAEFVLRTFGDLQNDMEVRRLLHGGDLLAGR